MASPYFALRWWQMASRVWLLGWRARLYLSSKLLPLVQLVDDARKKGKADAQHAARQTAQRESDSIPVPGARRHLDPAVRLVSGGLRLLRQLHRWRRFPDNYIGLVNYEKALGNLGYILFFWLALLASAAACASVDSSSRPCVQSEIKHGAIPLLAGVVCGYVTLLALDWFFKLIPVIMLIPRQVRGQNVSLTLFMEKFSESFTSPGVYEAGNWMLLGCLAAAAALALVVWRFRSESCAEVIVRSGMATAALLGGVFSAAPDD